MKKIMFNDRYGLTEAVLQGRKTVTRRLITGEMSQCWLMDCKDRDFQLVIEGNNLNAYTSNKEFYYSFGLPYKVGEIVAVAQSYGSLVTYNSDRYYPELTEEINKAYNLCCEHIGHLEEIAGWTNKMFVKAKLMPRKIRILDVRAEKLQAITDEDCLREGVRYINDIGKFYFERKDRDEGFYFDTTKEAFATLIDKISGKGTWKSNPYVWRIEFELIK